MTNYMVIICFLCCAMLWALKCIVLTPKLLHSQTPWKISQTPWKMCEICASFFHFVSLEDFVQQNWCRFVPKSLILQKTKTDAIMKSLLRLLLLIVVFTVSANAFGADQFVNFDGRGWQLNKGGVVNIFVASGLNDLTFNSSPRSFIITIDKRQD